MRDTNPRPSSNLTPAELEAAYFVGQGFWGWQLADQLSVRREDADRLVESILAKLGLDGRLDLWIYAKMKLAESPLAHA